MFNIYINYYINIKMSTPTVFFIHGEHTVFDANKSFFDFSNQDNYDIYCTPENPDPYSLGNNYQNIITLQCGHYVNTNMLVLQTFPFYPICCNNSECLNQDNCSNCQTDCIFACDLCSNFVSEINKFKNIINSGVENILDCNFLNQITENNNNDYNRKRKVEQSNLDIHENCVKKFSK